MSVHFNLSHGSYNWAKPTEKQWQLSLWTPTGRFSQTFPDDEKPELSGALPSDVLDMLEERVKSFWIYTGREEDLKKCALIRERMAEFDEAWLRSEMNAAQTRFEEAKVRLNRFVESRTEAA